MPYAEALLQTRVLDKKCSQVVGIAIPHEKRVKRNATRLRLPLLIAALLCFQSVYPQHTRTFSPRKVQVRFVHSPYADYLFYLLYRNTNDFSSVAQAVPLDAIPTAGGPISLSEVVASSKIKDYRNIYPLLKDYRKPTGLVIFKPMPKILGYGKTLPSYESLISIVRQGESSYPKFLELWEKEVAPQEQKSIEAWQKQNAQCVPLERLQELERVRFPFPSLDVGAIAFHFSGSNNTSPTGVYTRLFDKPNLAFTLGHEATHLIVNKYVGYNWTRHPRAAEAIDAVKKLGGNDFDIEESLCLFMQVTLPQECGDTSKAARVSSQLNDV